MFRTIGIVTKTEDERVKNALDGLLRYLRQRELPALIESQSAALLGDEQVPAAELEELGRRCELVIVIGGDGTLLRAARALAGQKVRVLGINLGRLGFLADISPCDINRHLDAILAGQFQEEPRFLLHAQAYRGEEELAGSDALNDVVIHKWNTAHMFSFQTYIDGSFVSDQRADGLILSTPTGSTAYALSGGGPILHPMLDAVLLIFIFPHSLSNRPIVVSANSRIEILIPPQIPHDLTAQLTCDGNLCQELHPGDRVVIQKAKQVCLIHLQGHDHYAVLRAKLHWGRG
jgi:NAD+ kinase